MLNYYYYVHVYFTSLVSQVANKDSILRMMEMKRAKFHNYVMNKFYDVSKSIVVITLIITEKLQNTLIADSDNDLWFASVVWKYTASPSTYP